LDILGAGQVQRTNAGFGQACEEDIPPLAKIGLHHLDAALQVRDRQGLVRFRVSYSNHVVDANFRCDGKVEMNWKW
jgi:hypothetical protein